MRLRKERKEEEKKKKKSGRKRMGEEDNGMPWAYWDSFLWLKFADVRVMNSRDIDDNEKPVLKLEIPTWLTTKGDLV